MEATPNLDWLLGGLAIAILLGGMAMLLSGVSGMDEASGKAKKK
ncbi:MAG: NAD synthetase [Synechococcales cyanobacterium RM1_1_8]|nr:NAD synthetase [Synechococcales cyanobacterium RM1_1_8]